MSMERPGAKTPPEFLQLAAHPLRWQLLATLADGDHRVRELAAHIAQPQNLTSYHLRLLRNAGLVSATRSSYDGRDSYYHLDLDRCAQALAESGAALHPALRRDAGQSDVPPAGRPAGSVAVLFVCTGNGSRSPMAEALLRRRTGGAVTVASAGTRPRRALHANTVRVLRELFGIDATGFQPRHIDTLVDRRFDHVITLCDRAREACPEWSAIPRRRHWSIPDPAAAEGTDDATYSAFRRTAAEVDTRVRHLLPVLAATHR
ncbi:metalloregulator ArsR/SmtB family transcription factor [Pseudonocardia alaniniphila]|uniref:Metalloregulator ArsR/SmtB family transcription factor n=2 Tax=Pseudonocardia alaniniphila TaxID=75291 RepID=A0ABS9TSJ1_9PSEU|nr:metalloregulator ArsR/SmtB family transcription factor [Pseudonocardia alaniniphila]MCH6171201.1 metalloregulator ArsR/SmtB family transcription factor [Pseudonocardia alaniniphila]